MANATSIEWCDLTWNPVHGCSKVSPGCAHCYAAELSLRYGHTVKPWTPANTAENVLLKPRKLREPLSGAKDWQGLGAAAAAAGKTDGKLVFVNSMSDLFHGRVPTEFIADVFAVMAIAWQHTFQILTKRPERAHALLNDPDFEDIFGACLTRRGRKPCMDLDLPLRNVWLGVSIENRRFVHRADTLRETPAAVRFISAEPLLGPLVHDALVDDDEINPEWEWSDGYIGPDLDLDGIDWLIVGGESGPWHRPMREEWVRDLRDAAQVVGTAFFFKQRGGARPGGEALLDGREWREFPAVTG